MEQLTEVQAEKVGTEDDVEDKLISLSITTIKKQSPKTNDDNAPKDGDTKDDETEQKTATATNTDCTIDDNDSNDIKDKFCKKVLQKCYSKLVSDMEPKSLLDILYEIDFLQHQTLRDIKEIPITSDKNRKIVEMTITKGGRGYEDMKSCLQRTKQDELLLHLAKIEKQLKQEKTKFKDVSILQSIGQPQSLEYEQQRQPQIEQPRPQHSSIFTEMKTALLRTYQNSELLSYPLFPLVQTKDMNIDELYVKPNMKHRGTKVDSYKELFRHNDQPTTNIYVVGEAGSGKTSFCKKMVSTWCKIPSETFDNVSEDQEAMTQFDLLFYISLRNAVDQNDIEEMIKNQLLDEEYHNQVLEVLKHKRCLVILDGLNEWGRKNTKAKLHYNKGIPGRKTSDYLTVLTTTRPWKLDAIELKDTQIARVELLGIEQSSSKQLIQVMLNHVNQEKKCHKKMEDFVSELVKKDLKHFMAIPVILKQLICLWIFDKDMGQTKTVVYCQTIELLIELAQNRLNEDPVYVNMKDEWQKSAIQLPSCFDENDTCQKYKPLIFLLSKLAFNAILAKDKESALVFKRSQAEKHGMTQSDIDMCLNIGILSQSSIIQKGKSQQKLSFLHESYQDFLVALFIALDIGECDQNIKTMRKHCTSLSKLMEMETVLTFIGGMCCSDTLCRLLSYIKSKDIATSYLQNIVKNGLKEGWCCSHDNQHLLTYAIDINPEDNQEHIELLCQVNTKHIRCIQIHTPPTPRCIKYIQQVHTLVQVSSQPPKPSRTSRFSSISTDIKNDLLSHTQNMVRILAKPKLTIESPSTASSKPSEEDIHDLIEHYNNIIRILFEEGVVIDPSSSSRSSSYRVCYTDQIFFRQAMQYMRDLSNLKEVNTTFEPHSSSRLSPLCEQHIYSIVEAIQNDIDRLTERQPATLSSVSSSSITAGSSHISEDILYDLIRNNTNTLVHLYIWHITPRSKTKLYNLLRNLPHLKWLCMTNATLPRQLLDSLQELKKQRPNVWIFITNPQILPDTDCTE